MVVAKPDGPGLRRVGRLAAVAAVVAVGLGLVAGPAMAASDTPDLDAFSGCVSAHGTLGQVQRGSAPRLAQLQLISATVAASRTRGARKVAKKLRRAEGGPAVTAALEAIATWCTAHGVPPITVPTTAAPG